MVARICPPSPMKFPEPVAFSTLLLKKVLLTISNVPLLMRIAPPAAIAWLALLFLTVTESRYILPPSLKMAPPSPSTAFPPWRVRASSPRFSKGETLKKRILLPALGCIISPGASRPEIKTLESTTNAEVDAILVGSGSTYTVCPARFGENEILSIPG